MMQISPSEARAKAIDIRKKASALNNELATLEKIKTDLDTAWKDETELRNSEIYKDALITNEQRLREMINHFDSLATTFDNLANEIESIKISRGGE